MFSQNLSTLSYLTLREMGEPSQNWQHRQRFAVLYPRVFKIQQATQRIDWQLLYRTHVDEHLKLLSANQKKLFEAILAGDLEQFNNTLHVGPLEDVRAVRRLFTIAYQSAWLGVNPFAAEQPHFSTDIQKMAWEFCVKESLEMRPLLQFAVITHQPVTSFNAILARFRHEDFIPKKLHECLMSAAQLNQMNTVRYLLEDLQVNPNFDEESNESPLTYAIANGNVEMVALLLAHHANVYFTNADEHQPIHIAAQSDSTVIVRLLLEHGASVHGCCISGELHTDVDQPIAIACSKGHLAVVKLLHEKGAKLVDDNNRSWPFQVACLQGHYHVAVYLLANGVAINAEVERDTIFASNHETMLHVACRRHHLELIKFLLAHGADINYSDENDITPLRLACMHDAGADFINYLLNETTADWFFVNENGTTPLHSVARHREGSVTVIRILEHFVNHLDLQAIDLSDADSEWHPKLESLSLIYSDFIVKVCANKPDLLLQYALLSGQDITEINRIIAKGASLTGVPQYRQLPYLLAQKIHPEVSERFNIISWEPNLSVPGLGAFSLFDFNLGEDDLPEPAEINAKKRNRE